ncbi:unnamed protein product, partial [Ectocarpus sp. 13 AM-2016]
QIYLGQEDWGGTAEGRRERQDPDRQHRHGHGQDQDLRLPSQGGGDRGGREGQDAQKVQENRGPRCKRLRQPPAHLQLPRTG